MSVQRTTPPVALIVLWPKSVGEESGAGQLVRRLSDRRLCSTWAVEEPSQAGSIRSENVTAPIELAMMVAGASSPVESIERGLDRFISAGEPVVAVHVGAALPRGSVERRLCQSGVRAIVGPVLRSESSTARPLPFGLWEFCPHMSVPAPRRWLGLFGRASGSISRLVGASTALACIDLARVHSTGSRGWHAVEQFVEHAAEASASGSARIISIADIVAELSSSTSARPQRSILRMAA